MEIYISQRRIAARIRKIGKEISEFYEGKPVTALVLMNGAMFFAADLCRHLAGDLFIDTIAVSSYRDNSSSGKLSFRGQAKLPMAGRHVLLVDGVLDTGLTLKTVKEWANGQDALSVRTCVLAEKAHKRPKDMLHADWAAFQLPDKYLVGYGMDDNELYRQLPFIAVVEPSE